MRSPVADTSRPSPVHAPLNDSMRVLRCSHGHPHASGAVLIAGCALGGGATCTRPLGTVGEARERHVRLRAMLTIMTDRARYAPRRPCRTLHLLEEALDDEMLDVRAADEEAVAAAEIEGALLGVDDAAVAQDAHGDVEVLRGAGDGRHEVDVLSEVVGRAGVLLRV